MGGVASAALRTQPVKRGLHCRPREIGEKYMWACLSAPHQPADDIPARNEADQHPFVYDWETPDVAIEH